MSPHTLADETVKTVERQAAIEPDRSPRPRPRLTVREMQIALDAARSLASPVQRAPRFPAGVCRLTSAPRGAAWIAATPPPVHDALEGNSPVTAPIVAPPLALAAAPDTPAVDPQAEHEPWLPEHDGPVSLTGIAAPRTRTVRRAAARPDKAARRPATKLTRPGRPRPQRSDPALAAAAAAAPPRIIVVPACGGAGATTTAVLLAAGLAPACGAILLAGGPDRGALAIRSNAEGGDPAALAEWARQHPRRPLRIDTPGVAIGTSGQDDLVVAASSRRPGQDPFDRRHRARSARPRRPRPAPPSCSTGAAPGPGARQHVGRGHQCGGRRAGDLARAAATPSTPSSRSRSPGPSVHP